MIELNVYEFWFLSVYIHPLRMIPQGTTLGQAFVVLDRAQMGLRQFLDHESSEILPQSKSEATRLVEIIDAIIPQGQPIISPERLLHEDEVNNLQNRLRFFEKSLSDEASRLYVLAVQDQRCLSSYTLIEKIDSCFPPWAWSLIEGVAKAEFEEAGRCLAFERYTASGFHSLRGIECVIRQCINEITGALPLKRDWGEYIRVLRDNGADPGLPAVLDNIRSLERNPLMHPEHWLNIDDAIGIFNISHTAIVRLATEMKKRKP